MIVGHAIKQKFITGGMPKRKRLDKSNFLSTSSNGEETQDLSTVMSSASSMMSDEPISFLRKGKQL